MKAYQLYLFDCDEWTPALRQKAIEIMESWIIEHRGWL